MIVFWLVNCGILINLDKTLGVVSAAAASRVLPCLSSALGEDDVNARSSARRASLKHSIV